MYWIVFILPRLQVVLDWWPFRKNIWSYECRCWTNFCLQLSLEFWLLQGPFSSVTWWWSGYMTAHLHLWLITKYWLDDMITICSLLFSFIRKSTGKQAEKIENCCLPYQCTLAQSLCALTSHSHTPGEGSPAHAVFVTQPIVPLHTFPDLHHASCTLSTSSPTHCHAPSPACAAPFAKPFCTSLWTLPKLHDTSWSTPCPFPNSPFHTFTHPLAPSPPSHLPACWHGTFWWLSHLTTVIGFS